MHNYCVDCEYRDECEYCDLYNFCVDCKDYYKCPLTYVRCKAGHCIECDNGFEEEPYLNDEDYENFDEDEEDEEW